MARPRSRTGQSELLPAAALEEIDQVCDRFEIELLAGRQPRIEDFLAEVPPPGRAALLRELHLLESEYRRKAGQAQGEERLGQRQGLRLCCPHCHNMVEAALDKDGESVVCSSCGQTFAAENDATRRWAQPAEMAASQPRTLGPLQLLEKLGEGAFGAVWKAHDTRLDRIVAVKIPRRGQLEPEEVGKFLREARAAAQLQHPNIVGVHEVGQQGETVYIVSDCIDGCSLAKWLHERQPTERQAAELCRKIALALDYAHGHGVVHRDLKPANVMMDRADEPHIMDFGLAKRESGETTKTVEGSVLERPPTCRLNKPGAKDTWPTGAATFIRWA